MKNYYKKGLVIAAIIAGAAVASADTHYYGINIGGGYYPVAFAKGGDAINGLASAHIGYAPGNAPGQVGWQERFVTQSQGWFQAYDVNVGAQDSIFLGNGGLLGSTLANPNYTVAGTLFAYDQTKNPQSGVAGTGYSVQSFTGTYLRDMQFPLLTYSASGPAAGSGYLTVKFQPRNNGTFPDVTTSTPLSTITSAVSSWAGYSATKWSTSAFTLSIAGSLIPAGTVTSIDAEDIVQLQYESPDISGFTKDPSDVVITYANPSVVPSIPTTNNGVDIAIGYEDTSGNPIGTLTLHGALLRGTVNDRLDYLAGKTPVRQIFSAQSVSWN